MQDTERERERHSRTVGSPPAPDVITVLCTQSPRLPQHLLPDHKLIGPEVLDYHV